VAPFGAPQLANVSCTHHPPRRRSAASASVWSRHTSGALARTLLSFGSARRESRRERLETGSHPATLGGESEPLAVHPRAVRGHLKRGDREMPRPNPSIERTSQRPLRALCAAAHVEG